MTAIPTVLVMAGGTGGHVFPALAVAQTLQGRGWLVHWMGTERGLEARVAASEDIEFHALPVQGLRGKGWRHRITAVFNLLRSLLQSLRLLLELKPNVVLGMGGYAAGPGGVAALLLGKPLVIHEQNAVAGTTNRLLAPLARRVLFGLPGAFEESRRRYWVGNPVRAAITKLSGHPHERVDAFSAERPMRLLILGGSLGSGPLNGAVPEVLRHLSKDSKMCLSIRHQCGDANLTATETAYKPHGDARVEVMAFIDDMAAAYEWADLVICRAGALTVSELALAGRAAILVPLPHAIDDHQTKNARILSDAGAGQVVVQDEQMVSKLVQLLLGLLAMPDRVIAMAEAASALAAPEATGRVADAVEEVAGDR